MRTSCKIMIILSFLVEIPGCTSEPAMPVVSVAMAADSVSKDEQIAVETIMLEDSTSYEGALGVAEVIRNRMKRDNKSAYQVCKKPMQFSCWNSIRQANRRLEAMTPEVFQRSARAWAESEDTKTVGGACFYYADYIKAPKWAKGMKETARIGHHVFLVEK